MTTINRLGDAAKSVSQIAIMAALLEGAKIALAVLPNIEIVTLLIILFTLMLGRNSLYAVFVFIGLECCLWGVHLWTVMYLFVWPVLVLLVLLFRKQSDFFFCVLAGVFGLCFGALCAVVYLFVGGPHMALAWWISGIPWDIVHGVSNFVLCLILLPTLRKLFAKMAQDEME